jgi:serine/threonine-protein kinase
MNKNDGPASVAPTAYAEAVVVPPTTNPKSSVAGAPITGVGGPQSGVSPASSALAGPQSLQPIGRVINGRYRIKRLLGEGGMGGVYEGEHLEIGKRVAIKLVHALHARDPQVAARIKQEARSTGSIESENIVQVFDAGEDPDLGIFLVMEMLKGEDLASLLARKKAISPMAAATMVLQAAQGLARAHAAGIVHRDLKPANIFLCTRDDGSSLVKLVDFGIAKLIRDANAAQQGPRQGALTRMGMVIGTPQYMSPEQAQGLLTVDHRTDVYSLGAVLFESVVGHSPFPEMPTYEQTILRIVTQVAPRLSQTVRDVPPELDQLVADMLAHDPNARPRDMSVVRERLARIFPQVEGGRMPMRSLTNEVGFDATVAADQSGQLRAVIDSVVRTGVGAAVQRPPSGPTPTAQSMGVVVKAQTAIDDEPVDDVAGVPGKSGAGMLVGVMLAFLVVGGLGAFLFLRAHAAPPPQAAGLAVPATPPTSAPTVAPPPVVAQAAAIPASPIAPVIDTPAPPSKPDKPDRHAKGGAKAAPAPATAAATPSASASAAPAPDRPVGGTGVQTEF